MTSPDEPPAQAPLPPINPSSPLLALQPTTSSASAVPDISDGAVGGFNFDTSELQHALMRSRQQAGGGGGLRRATSAPHSMDVLGLEPAQQQQQQQPVSGGAAYLPPSGGPMRRVASSLGMRRSSSFFWTPAAHHDFERATNALAARGVEVTAAAIMGEMRHHTGGGFGANELKLADVDKHLRKKQLVQRRVLQQLSDRPQVQTPVLPSSCPPATSAGSASMRMQMAPGLAPGLRAVVEEPVAGSAIGLGATIAGVGAASSAATAAAAQALSDSLAQQFHAQQMQHLQFAAARERLVADQQIPQQTSQQMPQQA